METRRKTPHSTLEQVCKRILPLRVFKFLFGPLSEFSVARRITGAVFGALSGAGLFFGLIYNIAMTTVQHIIVGCVFVGLCTLGGMFSSLFRCSVLLMFPSMIGSHGRTFLMVFVLHGLYQGPIANIQHNVQDVASSMGCNIDLQITHSKLMWRMLTEPYVEVVQEIVEDSEEFQNEAQNVSMQFQKVRDEVMGQYGFNSLGKESVHTANSTQEEYVAKTRARCDLMNPWCTEKIPVEGNFGQTFDKLNDSINRLAEHFTTNLVLEELEQQAVLGVNVLQDFSKELSREFQEKTAIAEKISGVINFLLSFTFITVFTSAFGYVRQYCRDILFDNVYITTYFRQIDARRIRAEKRHLLPLKKAERESLINPWRLSIHASELMPVIVGFLQVASLALFVCVLLAVDGILYNIFDLIRRHTFTTYSITSVQHADIVIGGDSMLARLLRKTIGAFNTSSNFDIESSNLDCLPQPHSLILSDYLRIFIPLLLMFLMCLLQVYSNRLRRREKKRILFLYNLQIQKRISFINRQCHRLRNPKQTFVMVLSGVLAPLKRVGCRLLWCCVCEGFVRQNQAVECSSVGCTMIYCQQCWTDLDNICCICYPRNQCAPQDSSYDSEVYYGC
ncbi:E3 ubiquitin-protein ligase DCST1 isoform X7 [Danio rerio]|uniref:E3 ubiquitin-protein ligase DCST1 isoform X7 n=2 Tax=Danio rerio TaxID=7955 RepID=A0AC58HJN3_DANRE